MYDYAKMITRLRKFIRKQDISIKKLSETTNISYRTLYKIFTMETKDPSINIMVKIAEVLNISLDDIAFGENISKNKNVEMPYIDKYKVLDTFGKKAVNEILNIEYERCIQDNKPIIIDRFEESMAMADAIVAKVKENQEKVKKG